MSILSFSRNNLIDETGENNWSGLTVMPEKKDFYSRETYFRESWIDAESVLKDNSVAVLQKIAVLVMKPDAFMARKVTPALDYLRDKGFIPICWREIRYNRWSMREDWRYQLNQLSTDRLYLNEKLLTSEDCTLIVFRYVDEYPVIPGTVRLQSLKGNSLPEFHKPGQLRSILNSQNRLFKFVHTADEPADIVRELGIIFSSDERLSLYRDILLNIDSERTGEIKKHLDKKTERFEYCDFNWQKALDELILIANKSGDSEAVKLSNDIACWLKNGLPTDKYMSAIHFEHELKRLNLNLSELSFMIISTNLIHHSYALEFALMRGDGLDDWLAGKGKLFQLASINN